MSYQARICMPALIVIARCGVGKHEANAGLRLNVKVRYNIQEVGVVRAEPV